VVAPIGSMGTFGLGQIEAPTTFLDQSKFSIFIGAFASPIRQDMHAFGMTLECKICKFLQ